MRGRYGIRIGTSTVPAGVAFVGIGRYRTNTITHALTFLAIHPSKEGDSLRSYSFFLEGDSTG